jgi:hypothetical protein
MFSCFYFKIFFRTLLTCFKVFCVVTTASCFAPRCADNAEGVARLLATHHPEVND